MTDWLALIRRLKTEQHYSTRELADRTGIHRSAIRRFLEGKSSINVERLETILNALGSGLTYTPPVPVPRPPRNRRPKIIPFRNGRIDEEKPPCP